MSCTPIFSVWCDGGVLSPGCHVWTAQEESKASARKTARLRGWWCGRSGSGVINDYCPACRKLRDL